MNRRGALAGLVAALAALSPAAWAQARPRAGATARSPARLVILWLGPEEWLRDDILPPLLREMAALGYVEGKNLEVGIEKPPPESTPERLATAVAKIAAAKPDIVLTYGTPGTRAMSIAAPHTPVVASVADPVGSGFARTLASPGGNVTGLSHGAPEAARKGLDVMRALVPRLSRLAIVFRDTPHDREFVGHITRAAAEAGVEPLLVAVAGDDEEGFARAAALRPSAAYLSLSREGCARIAAAALRARLAVFSNSEECAEVGLLASYNSERPDQARRTAAIVHRVLGGADPATIPFELPERYRLVVNRVTAAALGVSIPPEVVLRVDRFIG
jgi:putative ABC transport system substrate-binding protein